MKTEKSIITQSFKNALRTLYTIAPMLLAVIGLVGLFQTYITPQMIHSFFTGSTLYDTLIGTITGAISVGQPFISYIIGGELNDQGISLYAITAFILSFVTLGLVQLPLEYSLFGMRFTLVRNLLSFLFSILVSLVTVYTLEVVI
ncbi:permease [Sulfurovum sp. zt1-1]|uniref:Permease n=1 Tax=Sulfurovum zhangzhouensis TaxID=3019067 RepID=A0ABT7QYG1_9BACT|nr:permease [Sulfurovum zhangzhouensis]MDM5271874.1 permease [Sulfurovum zhangzhouensis]